MNVSKVQDLLVSKLPEKKNADFDKTIKPAEQKREFETFLHKELSETSLKKEEVHGIQLSNHAAKRLKERNINVDGGEFLKIKLAIDKLKNKGGKDSLVITETAAYIVDVNNNKIVTAMDKDNMVENVFTKIDSTLFVD